MAATIALALAAAQPGAGATPPPDAAAPAAPLASPVPTGAETAEPPAVPSQTQPGAAPSSEPAAPAGKNAPLSYKQDEATIVVTARPKYDPLLGTNLKTYEVTQAVDDAVVAPLARVYEHGLPKPVRGGLHNFIRNIGSPIVALNFLLQLKPGKAAETLGRFAINSTIGVGGLIDVAKNKPFNLPYRHNGFANTLGYYGVKPGPFLFIPLVGPTTLRDVLGGAVDATVLPLGIGAPFNKPYYTLPNGAVRSLDRRVEFDCQLQEFRKADDPYAVQREFYLAKREAEIEALHGRGPGPKAEKLCRGMGKGAIEVNSLAPPAAPADQPAAPPTAAPPAPDPVPPAPAPAPAPTEPSSAPPPPR